MTAAENSVADPRPAETLSTGARIAWGDGWREVVEATIETPRISAPIVRIRALDERGEIRCFTLPADLPIRTLGEPVQ